MQFYLNGYQTGDPLVEEPHPSVAGRSATLPKDADVLIVGCGPAGLILASQLARFPEIKTVVVDRRDVPLQVGQADGVACRTVEMFEAFGLASRLVDEAYWVNEVCFWQPDPEDRTRIKRSGRVRDTDAGLSEFPHVIVNQARMLAYLLEHMERSSSRLTPFYGLHASGVTIDTSTEAEYPVTVTLRHLQSGEETGNTSTIRARYVIGCDGARSAVRTAIGRELVGDTTNASWGVMDVLTSTDFPDIRLKCTIQSADSGTIVLIPREGGYLSRVYVELGRDREHKMLQSGDVTLEQLTTVANRILHPYTLEVRDVGWWSVYEVGQRLCDKFDDVPNDAMDTRLPRVFIAGDACHTHSAKAGQGMNVSMADAFNLGWKLAAVLRKTARPELLHTYSEERQRIARELIDFDEEWSRMLSMPPRRPGETDTEGVDTEEFQRYFIQHARYTAGVAAKYSPSMITGAARFQHLAEGFPVGMRFHSAPVIRLADAKPVQLGHAARADGAWRLYIFGDGCDPAKPDSKARALCEFLRSDASPLTRFTPPGDDPDSVIDVRAVFQQSHHELSISIMPPVLLPRKGRFNLVDYEKIFCSGPDVADVFDLRKVNRAAGCMILVRPDQYVSDVFPLEAHEMLDEFLLHLLTEASSPTDRTPLAR
ncbi:MAG TPA: FAD-dependent monooxygenase [Solirubrobacteraceae bacterium]|nr:FAD-dependent monooxygenase [Solirubrobacteraceae bacterium]